MAETVEIIDEDSLSGIELDPEETTLKLIVDPTSQNVPLFVSKIILWLQTFSLPPPNLAIHSYKNTLILGTMSRLDRVIYRYIYVPYTCNKTP